MATKPTTWHLTDNGIRTLCGKPSPNRIHTTYARQPLDNGKWCALCRRNNRSYGTMVRILTGPRQ